MIFIPEAGLLVCSKVLSLLKGGGNTGHDLLLPSCSRESDTTTEEYSDLSNPPGTYSQRWVDRNTRLKAHQRGRAIVLPGIHFGAQVKHRLHHLVVAVHGGHHQRGISALAAASFLIRHRLGISRGWH
jgi:hypothetical protein